jgi:hypothetical protein
LHDFNAQKVTGVVGVDAVGDPEIHAGFAFRGQHGIPKVDEQKSGLGGDVVFDDLVADAFVSSTNFTKRGASPNHQASVAAPSRL